MDMPLVCLSLVHLFLLHMVCLGGGVPLFLLLILKNSYLQDLF